jgi:hypothetical protein
MKRFIPLLTIFLCVAATATAREIGGLNLAEEITQSSGTVLQLNGAGIRSKFFFKIYVGALYLEEKNSAAPEVIGREGGKQIFMHFLYDEVGKEDLVEAWNDGFQANGSPARLGELAQQIDSFNAMFDTVKSGDVIVLDYQPGNGTSVFIRNQKKGTIPGKPFNDLLLSIWLGEKPVTKALRDDLLGK